MFIRLIARAIWHRKLASSVTLVTIILGVGMIGGLVNVYKDMDQKMSKEFRAYGANLLIYPAEGAAGIGKETAGRLTQELAGEQLVGIAPLQYGIAYAEKKPFVLVGTSFSEMRRVSPYWNVEGTWSEDRSEAREALVGADIADKFDLKPGSAWDVTSDGTGAAVTLQVTGIVTTGGKEDQQVFISLEQAGPLLASDQTDIFLVSLLEKGDALPQRAALLEERVPGISAKPIKQFAQSEAKLAGKIQKLIYLVSAVIVVTTALTVTTTMISLIMERRKEIALKKALGAADLKLLGELLAEGMALGIVGTGLGMALAYYIAQAIGQTVFHADITFRVSMVPWLGLGTLVLIGAAFIVPIRRLMEIDPAVALKGE